MGHSTIALTERYAHIGDTALNNAVDSLDKRLIAEGKK
jgi:hypothetical protein